MRVNLRGSLYELLPTFAACLCSRDEIGMLHNALIGKSEECLIWFVIFVAYIVLKNTTRTMFIGLDIPHSPLIWVFKGPDSRF